MTTGPAAQVVDRLLAHLRPALEDHGEWDEVSGLVERTVAGGNGAARQRAAHPRSHDFGEVIALLWA